MFSGTGDYAKTQKEKLEQQLLPYFPDIEITVEAYPEEQYYDPTEFVQQPVAQIPDLDKSQRILPYILNFERNIPYSLEKQSAYLNSHESLHGIVQP